MPEFTGEMDLNEFAELGRRLHADGWIRFANREHRWCSAEETIMDLLPAGPKLRAAKQVTWPVSQFTMSLVGFEHVFCEDQGFLETKEETEKSHGRRIPQSAEAFGRTV
jgi:hypothetical protein